VKLDRQQSRLIKRIERIDQAARGVAVGFPCPVKLLRHPWVVLMNRSLLKDDAAGGDFDQIAHRHNEGVDLE
jgi:hypothetical protein